MIYSHRKNSIFVFIIFFVFGCSVLVKHSTKQDIDNLSTPDVWTEGDWIISVTECTAINISRDDAMKRALKEARKKAIEYAVGLNISSSQLLTQSSTRLTSFTSYINTTSYGKIIEEQKPQWKQIEAGQNNQGLTFWAYQVTLKCQVSKEEGLIDPGFIVQIKSNQMKYREGDSIQYKVTASRDCYLAIFNIYENDNKVLIIFPNDIDKNNRLFANEERIIPDPNSGISLEAMLPEGKNESRELVWVIATKEPLDFSMGLKKISAFSYLPTPVAAVTEINRRLVAIPLNERSQTSDILLIEK